MKRGQKYALYFELRRFINDSDYCGNMYSTFQCAVIIPDNSLYNGVYRDRIATMSFSRAEDASSSRREKERIVKVHRDHDGRREI